MGPDATAARGWSDGEDDPRYRKEDTVTADLAGEPPAAGRSRRLPAPPAPAGRCPGCGLSLPAQSAHGPVLRAAVPAPIAAALLLADTLSAREGAVFELLGMGYDNRSIARAMRLSERTVKRHVTVILAKLRLESRLQAGLTALIIFSSSPQHRAWPEGRMASGPFKGDDINESMTVAHDRATVPELP